MLYTDDTRIEALALHLVGNKMKDEPLLLSPGPSTQTGDEELTRILVAYFLGGFKGEETYNLFHESDLECNEVYRFACRIFDDAEHFYDHSVALARHLYEAGGHPPNQGRRVLRCLLLGVPPRRGVARRGGAL